MNAQQVLDFWFSGQSKPFWFAKSGEFDGQIRTRFHALWQAAQGCLARWRENGKGRLAEILVLDQFSRNLNRNSPQAFVQDGMALILAQEILKQPDFGTFTETERQFALLPFMHSESADIHRQAVSLFERFTGPEVLEFELKHKAVIDRFGRYPHRNAVLGRESTQAELEFLKQPGSVF